MRILDGNELVGYIKERQAKQVRALRQSWRVIPKLAIVCTGNNPVNEKYMQLKKEYGSDILIEVDVYNPTDLEIIDQIKTLNADESVIGIIVQLPLADPEMTDQVISTISTDKDVDGLASDTNFISATAMAIDWLMAGYNIDIDKKKIAIIGNGRLVGAPLYKLWANAGCNVDVYDIDTVDLAGKVLNAEIVVSATGVPSLIKSSMLREKAIVVDAGTASENGRIVGDIAPSVRDRDDLTITPIRGGVGPLTVAALFDNVIKAARKIADQKGQQDL